MTNFAVLPATLTQATAFMSLGAKPLVVVTAPVDAQEGWVEAQETMLSLSLDSSQRVAPGQSHGSLIESEAGAAISAQAIEDVVAAVRTGASLAGRMGRASRGYDLDGGAIGVLATPRIP